MKNSTIERVLLALPIFQFVFFLIGYYPGGIREFTLLIFLGIAGFPGAFVGIPLSEAMADRIGINMGSESQAWIAIILSILCNIFLILGLIKMSRNKKF